MSFGDKLTTYRVRYGMNKKTLAERIGITYSHLGQIENNHVSPPRAKTIIRISEILRLSQEEKYDLLDEAKNPK